MSSWMSFLLSVLVLAKVLDFVLVDADGEHFFLFELIRVIGTTFDYFESLILMEFDF